MSETITILRPDHPTDSFIGVGPGRCGSLSLAKILDECDGVKCTHEAFHTTEHYTLDICEMLLRMEPKNDGKLHGQVGAMWLGVLPFIRLQFPQIKVVCLHRDRDAVVASFLKRQKVRERPWILNPIGVLDRVNREFLEQHWHWCERQMARLEEPVFHMATDDLNSDSILCRLFEFLEIPKAARQFPHRRRYHVGDDGVVEVENPEQIEAFRAIKATMGASPTNP